MPTQPGKTLYSQHYLDNRLPQMPAWAEDVAAPFAESRVLYDAQRELLPTYTKGQTEEEFIRPALNILGWPYIVQPRHGRDSNLTRPDYALFADDSMKGDAQRHRKDDAAFSGRALAIDGGRDRRGGGPQVGEVKALYRLCVTVGAPRDRRASWIVARSLLIALRHDLFTAT